MDRPKQSGSRIIRRGRKQEDKIMQTNRDWMPGPRPEILSMCQNWIAIMDAETRTAWGVPSDGFVALGTDDFYGCVVKAKQ
jgi:hypothetical protein